VSDTAEDRAEEIVTPSVRYGPRAAMRIAVASLVPACVLIGGGLVAAARPVYALVGVAGAAGCDRLPLVGCCAEPTTTIPPSPF